MSLIKNGQLNSELISTIKNIYLINIFKEYI